MVAAIDLLFQVARGARFNGISMKAFSLIYKIVLTTAVVAPSFFYIDYHVYLILWGLSAAIGATAKLLSDDICYSSGAGVFVCVYLTTAYIFCLFDPKADSEEQP
jgi:hypothetical protein